MVRPSSSSSVRVTDPSGLTWPALKTVPSGKLSSVMVTVEPVVVGPALISRGKVPSSSPVAGVTSSVGAPTTGVVSAAEPELATPEAGLKVPAPPSPEVSSAGETTSSGSGVRRPGTMDEVSPAGTASSSFRFAFAAGILSSPPTEPAEEASERPDGLSGRAAEKSVGAMSGCASAGANWPLCSIIGAKGS